VEPPTVDVGETRNGVEGIPVLFYAQTGGWRVISKRVNRYSGQFLDGKQ
jgi:hypothetical protein